MRRSGIGRIARSYKRISAKVKKNYLTIIRGLYSFQFRFRRNQGDMHDVNLIFLIGIALRQPPVVNKRKLATLFALYFSVYFYVNSLYEGVVSSEVTIPPTTQQIQTYKSLFQKGFYMQPVDKFEDAHIGAEVMRKGINFSVHINETKCPQGVNPVDDPLPNKCAFHTDLDRMRTTLYKLRLKYRKLTCNSVAELLFEGLIVWPVWGQRSDLLSSFIHSLYWNGLFQFYKSLHDFVEDKPKRWKPSTTAWEGLGLGPNTVVSFQLFGICIIISMLAFLAELCFKRCWITLGREEITPVNLYFP